MQASAVPSSTPPGRQLPPAIGCAVRREVAPEPRGVYFDTALGLWVASGSQLVAEVLAHPACRACEAARLVSALCAAACFPANPAGAAAAACPGRLEGLVAALLEGVLPAQVRELARDCAATSLKAAGGALQGGALTLYCQAVPAHVLGRVLGAQSCDLQRLSHWAVSRLPCSSPQASEDQHLQGRRAAQELVAYMAALMDTPPGGVPGHEVLTRLKALSLRRRDLPVTQVLARLALLFYQVHEASSELIAATLLALHLHPELASLAKAEPVLLPLLVREVLRQSPPLRQAMRLMAEDMVLAGERVAAGDTVLLLLAATRRPCTGTRGFQLDRKSAKVFTFGAQPFASPGQMMAETIAAEAVRALLRAGLDLGRLGYGTGPWPTAT
ncbi:hypothetical protein OOT46_13975 [Aquabacterium sp. A7-Y]|uniref:hypothetical protein n=1 Tax=Aquabacterium sp. A7-Y TaxID=1349605 RepID=UPI00223E0439|nr:hypothetical protein [Aquabacterium sp. A7-Y]MCW7538949.1 hypothetical protein [Aquabacterium sp. A7-Y]